MCSVNTNTRTFLLYCIILGVFMFMFMFMGAEITGTYPKGPRYGSDREASGDNQESKRGNRKG